MLVRPLARLLLAAPFVRDGVDAVHSPEPHLATARTSADIATRLLHTERLSDGQLRLIVRAHGALVVTAALGLALGKVPRSSALLLTGLTAPLVVAQQPFRSAVGRTEVPAFLRALGLLGGTMLAASDTAGRPSVGWRVRHAREERRAAHAED